MKCKNLFDMLIYFPFFRASLILGSIPARLEWNTLTLRFMRLNAHIVLRVRKARPEQDLLAVALEWKRMFPASGMQKIISSDPDTVYAETHTWCPLRNSGDVRACFRMMEFDRCMLEKIGGQFIVLQSQAEPGVKICQIAIRKPGSPTDDLIPAHERAGKIPA